MAVGTITVTFDKASGVCRTGAHLHASNGDDIEWDNQTGGEVTVFFPHDNVLGLGSKRHHFPISHRHKHSPGRLHGQPKGQRLPYAVYCSINNTFAEGNSTPEIIIDG